MFWGVRGRRCLGVHIMRITVFWVYIRDNRELRCQDSACSPHREVSQSREDLGRFATVWVRWTSHLLVIVTLRDNGDYVQVLLYSDSTTISTL